MTREERIEAALATVGMTTPEPWIESNREALIHAPEGSGVGYIAMIGDTGNDFGNSLDDIFITKEVLANMALITAAPDLRDEVITLRAQMERQRKALELIALSEVRKINQDPYPCGNGACRLVHIARNSIAALAKIQSEEAVK